MTVVPEFELPEYKGIEVKVPSSEVTEADVEEALNSLAEQIAEFTPVDRAAKKAKDKKQHHAGYENCRIG